jgi:hypothetical protein
MREKTIPNVIHFPRIQGSGVSAYCDRNAPRRRQPANRDYNRSVTWRHIIWNPYIDLHDSGGKKWRGTGLLDFTWLPG